MPAFTALSFLHALFFWAGIVFICVIRYLKTCSLEVSPIRSRMLLFGYSAHLGQVVSTCARFLQMKLEYFTTVIALEIKKRHRSDILFILFTQGARNRAFQYLVKSF
jgi:hypothetical protein